jgi:hypothetical protein
MELKKVNNIKEQDEEFDSYIEVMRLSAVDPELINQNVNQTVKDDYVEFGKNDTQFDKLLTLYVGSNTHNAITDSVSHMIYGNGLNTEGVIEEDDNKRIIKDSQIFGNYSMQVTADDIFHMPVNYLRAQPANDEGVIEGYWFSTNFADPKVEKKWFPAWSEDWQPTEEFPSAIYYGKSYTPNAFYYGLPSWQGGISYMEQEIAIASFLIKYIRNNFSVSKIINFNNGVQDPKSRKRMKKGIEEKLTGPDGDTIVVAFNKSKDHAATIEDVTVSNASEQYAYMSENARGQIVVAHQITSPLIVGIRDTSTGFSSNADEMAMSRAMLEEMNIKPNQEWIAKAYQEIKRNPNIEYVSSIGDVREDADTVIDNAEDVELKKVNPHLAAFIKMGVDKIEGCKHILSVDIHNQDQLEVIMGSLKEFEHEPLQMASSGSAKTLQRSEQDDVGFIVRYRYVGNQAPQRSFCRTMMNANKLYRIEDIRAMEDKPVNRGFGLNGAATYDIWLWKGGGMMSDTFPQGTCKHMWRMEIWAADQYPSGNVKELEERISINQARRFGVDVPEMNPIAATPPHSM